MSRSTWVDIGWSVLAVLVLGYGLVGAVLGLLGDVALPHWEFALLAYFMMGSGVLWTNIFGIEREDYAPISLR